LADAVVGRSAELFVATFDQDQLETQVVFCWGVTIEFRTVVLFFECWIVSWTHTSGPSGDLGDFRADTSNQR
jgi:hypothetical protein